MNADKRTLEGLLREGERLAEERRQELEAEENARLEQAKQDYEKVRSEVCQALPEVLGVYVTHCWRNLKHYDVVSLLEIINWAPIKIYFVRDSDGLLNPARFDVFQYVSYGYEGEELDTTCYEHPETLAEALLSARNLGNNKSKILEIIEHRKQKPEEETKALSLGDQLAQLIRGIVVEGM